MGRVGRIKFELRANLFALATISPPTFQVSLHLLTIHVSPGFMQYPNFGANQSPLTTFLGAAASYGASRVANNLLDRSSDSAYTSVSDYGSSLLSSLTDSSRNFISRYRNAAPSSGPTYASLTAKGFIKDSKGFWTKPSPRQ